MLPDQISRASLDWNENDILRQEAWPTALVDPKLNAKVTIDGQEELRAPKTIDTAGTDNICPSCPAEIRGIDDTIGTLCQHAA